MTTPERPDNCSSCGLPLPGSRICARCTLPLAGAPSAATNVYPPPIPAPQHEFGHQVGRFTVLGVLGTGGFATVYRAEDTQLRRQVALKLLHPHLSENPIFAQRFLAEARAMARLRHPHIVTIYDVGETADRRLYLVMELLEGTPLAARISQETPVPPEQVGALLTQLAAALDYLHQQGLVHRDLKPANVMVSEAGAVTLMDFGIARTLEEEMPLTQTGQVVGTVAYMAPEQISGGAIGPATDIYALGLLAYELFAGRPPFTGSTTSVMLKQLQETPPPLAELRPGLPAVVYEAVAEALAKAPGQRPVSAGTFAAAFAGLSLLPPPTMTLPRTATPQHLLSAVRSSPWHRRRPIGSRPGVIGVVMGIVLLASAGIAVFHRTQGNRATVPTAPRTAAPRESGPGTSVVPRTATEAGMAPLSIAAVVTLAGSGVAGFAEGQGTAAQFSGPNDLTVDTSGTVYVADAGNYRIRKITPDGTVTTLAGSGLPGHADGPGTSAQFINPAGIVVDGAGIVYVTDVGDYRIRKITPDGTVTTVAGSGVQGFADGPAASAQFAFPAGIAVDASGIVYVADAGNYRIRKITPDGAVTTYAGSGLPGFADGLTASAQFAFPLALAGDVRGNLYVTDVANHRIRKIALNGTVTTLAGSEVAGLADGTGNLAQFSSPGDLKADLSGTLYLTDVDSPRIRRITPDGTVTTLPDLGKPDLVPSGIAVDRAGTLYFTDNQHHRVGKVTLSSAR
ncbi:MAG: protein kinase domain-containing protein [Dehalococcoidia bacterium]